MGAVKIEGLSPVRVKEIFRTGAGAFKLRIGAANFALFGRPGKRGEVATKPLDAVFAARADGGEIALIKREQAFAAERVGGAPFDRLDVAANPGDARLTFLNEPEQTHHVSERTPQRVTLGAAFDEHDVEQVRSLGGNPVDEFRAAHAEFPA